MIAAQLGLAMMPSFRASSSVLISGTARKLQRRLAAGRKQRKIDAGKTVAGQRCDGDLLASEGQLRAGRARRGVETQLGDWKFRRSNTPRSSRPTAPVAPTIATAGGERPRRRDVGLVDGLGMLCLQCWAGRRAPK